MIRPVLFSFSIHLTDEQAGTYSENPQKAEDACLPSFPTLSDADAEPNTDADGNAGASTDAGVDAGPSIEAGVDADPSADMSVDADEPHEGDKKPPDDGMDSEKIKEVKEGESDAVEKGEVEGETNADTAEGKGGSTRE